MIEGDATVFTGGGTVVHLPDAGVLAGWATRVLRAMSMARTPRFFKDGDGRFPITFAPDDDHPLGRGVRVDRGTAGPRMYRIDVKGRLRRREDADRGMRVTRTYDGFVRACPGRILPTRIHIVRSDIAMQTVLETTEIEDGYERHAHVWLPVLRRSTAWRAHERRERALELFDHVELV